jgi:hypothetical protein
VGCFKLYLQFVVVTGLLAAGCQIGFAILAARHNPVLQDWLSAGLDTAEIPIGPWVAGAVGALATVVLARFVLAGREWARIVLGVLYIINGTMALLVLHGAGPTIAALVGAILYIGLALGQPLGRPRA